MMRKKQKIEVQVGDGSEESDEMGQSDLENPSDSDEGFVDKNIETEDSVTASDEELAEPQKNQKRKIQLEESPKLKKHKRIKPPTADEMIRLKETENLYQSNLFRLQIEEMINELKPRKTDKNAIKHWIQNFKNFLQELPDCEVVRVNHELGTVEDIVLPVMDNSGEIGNNIKFYKPLDVQLFGSYPNGTVIGPYFVLDVILVVPKNYFYNDDYLNQKYHYKRALYLSLIISRIRKSSLVNNKDYDIKFWQKSGDPLKPVLLFRPVGRMTQFVEIALNVLPEESPFKMSRFLPEKNNVRPECCGFERKSGKLPPTPNYNMSVVEDMVASKNEQLKLDTFKGKQNLKDAVVLLNVWLKQRKLSQGFGAFNMHLLSLFMVYLVKTQKINDQMSSYQISRNVWLAIAQTDWTKKGLSLCNDETPCSLESFHDCFDVVFIDCTGYYNLCRHLNKSVYLRVKEEAERAIKFLNDPAVNSFQSLFMIDMPFLHQFDHCISFSDPDVMENAVKKCCDQDKVLDHYCDSLTLFIKLITNYLQHGLGNRLASFCLLPASLPQWKISESRPRSQLNDMLLFGLKLNPETALTILEKGPQANLDEAQQFREFWGDKCELRRFRDGTVCEAVCWHDGDVNLNDRRMITYKIVQYLLQQKLGIPPQAYNYVANQLDSYVKTKMNANNNTTEEASQAVHKVYDTLSQQIRDITDIPLSIVSVRCISPVYRFTDVFPPLPIAHSINKKVCRYSDRGVMMNTNENLANVPFYVQPIDMVLQMAMSQKWPNDLKAGKRLIAAFNIVLASSLKKHYKLNCQITTDYVIVQKDGYIFRLYIGYSKAIGLLKQQISDEGVTFYRDTPESVVLEKKFINLPKITGALYGLSQTYSGYGLATCLAKRWVNSHLLDDFHFPLLVVELLMARLFISPEPFTVPVQPLTAFLRFLKFISTTNWHIEPIIINFNNLLTREQIIDIEKSFLANRDSLPSMVIPTPYDVVGTLWTNDAPSLPTLIRLSKLAAASLKLLEVYLMTTPSLDNLRKIFEPPLSHYDVLINLKKTLLPKRLNVVDIKFEANKKCVDLPVSGFDPATNYLQDLRENYGKYALFFYDSFGGTTIGVLFKPNFLEASDFKVSNVGPTKPILSEEKVSLISHKDALINGFTILGKGLVHNIEFNR